MQVNVEAVEGDSMVVEPILEGSVRSGVEPGGDVGEGAGPLHQARQPRGQLQQLGVVG